MQSLEFDVQTPLCIQYKYDLICFTHCTFDNFLPWIQEDINKSISSNDLHV